MRIAMRPHFSSYQKGETASARWSPAAWRHYQPIRSYLAIAEFSA